VTSAAFAGTAGVGVCAAVVATSERSRRRATAAGGIAPASAAAINRATILRIQAALTSGIAKKAGGRVAARVTATCSAVAHSSAATIHIAAGFRQRAAAFRIHRTVGFTLGAGELGARRDGSPADKAAE
jgi:hypothetical protein